MRRTPRNPRPLQPSQTRQLITGDTILTINGRQMSFANLTSMGNSSPEATWDGPVLEFDPLSVAMHPPTNVVAICQCDVRSAPYDEESTPKIHILQMSNEESYPFLTKQILSLQPESLNDFKKIERSFVSISQSTVAIVFRGYIRDEAINPDGDKEDEDQDEGYVYVDDEYIRPGGRLFVWNWRTGEQIYSKGRVGYRAMTLVNDTWLVALWSKEETMVPWKNRSSYDYALHVIDTSNGNAPGASFQLRVPNNVVGGDCGLYSGESALYNRTPEVSHLQDHPSSATPDAMIVALVRKPQEFPGVVRAQCFAIGISKLLELGQAKNSEHRFKWQESKDHVIEWERDYIEHFKGSTTHATDHIKHNLSTLSFSGRRFMWPVGETEQDRRSVEIDEFKEGDQPGFQKYLLTETGDLKELQGTIVDKTIYTFKHTREGVVELVENSLLGSLSAIPVAGRDDPKTWFPQRDPR